MKSNRKSNKGLYFAAAALLTIFSFFVGAQAQTSRLVPFSNVVTNIPPSTPAQALTLQLWDVPTDGAAPLFAESQTLDVDASGNISFTFGSATAGGLDPANFPSGSSRYLDVVNSTSTSVLAARLPLNATSFALSPGPAGPKGDKGDPGPPGGVNSVIGGDASIFVGGTPADPIVSVAPNGISDSKVANGALSPAKIAGIAATLGANRFSGTQTIETLSDRYGTTHTDGTVTVGSYVGTDISGSLGGYLGTRSNHPLFLFTNNGFAQVTVSPAGNVGIGTTSPADKLTVRTATNSYGVLHTDGNITLGTFVGAGSSGADSAWLGTRSNHPLRFFTGNNPATLTLGTDGTTSVKVLQILGGADVAERFEVRAPKTTGERHDNRIEPGMVVSIDPNRPGALMLSNRAYDHRIAGVISGAGGVNAGMLMGQAGSVAGGDQPVALAGRVYCWADISNGPIRPGDLLTTSGTPGSAMKVTNHKKARGAIIGKAMTPLNRGKGFVLVLVSLQ